MTAAQQAEVEETLRKYTELSSWHYKMAPEEARREAEVLLSTRGYAALRHAVWVLHDPYKDEVR